MNKAAIEAAGFKVNDKEMVFDGNRRISKDLIPLIEAGVMFASGQIDTDAVRKGKQRKAANGGKNLVEELAKISPAIAMLPVGMTAKLAIPTSNAQGKNPKRAFVMSIVTKLNNLTASGRDWAGRRFDTVSDEAGENVFIARLPDTDTPHVRKSPTGRKAANADSNLAAALQASKAHLNGEQVDPAKAAEAILEGEQVRSEGGAAAVTEEATVLQH